MNQQQIADKAEIEHLQKENETMRLLVTFDGFYLYYYNELPNHGGAIKTFHYVNNLYFKLFGIYRYSDYNAFKQQVNRTNQKKK